MPVGVAEVVLLTAALGIGESAAHSGRIATTEVAPYVAAAACLAAAMTLQAVMLRQVGSRTIRTTFVTGVLTDLAETLVVGWFRPDRRERKRILHLLGWVWLLYLGGAVAGAAAEHAWSLAALAVPIVVLAPVTAWAFHTGYGPSLPEHGIGE